MGSGDVFGSVARCSALVSQCALFVAGKLHFALVWFPKCYHSTKCACLDNSVAGGEIQFPSILAFDSSKSSPKDQVFAEIESFAEKFESDKRSAADGVETYVRYPF